ncbi:cryptochrome/photolyase family protein [Streptomyces sp. NPDC058534]|uniref:cryptochrome/photolyase family protein n=1 Tax=Streptomyces sp. NPDC058534 TaxID=3346541 RepID=UPI003665C4A6
MGSTVHWLFGDQLGPHFLAPGEHGPGGDTPLLMVEARSVFRRSRFHRAKAHLVLSAMRHRAAELGDRVTYVRADTYREGLDRAAGGRPVTVHHPTSYAAVRLVRSLPRVTAGPARGFMVPTDDFATWADGHGGGRLRQEDFYRWVRRRHELLMDGDSPAGGRWNFDHDNRQPPPREADTLPVPAPYRPREVVGMSQYADGGRMTTKPYTSGGAYVHRMSDLCGPCRYRPGDRTGEHACPYTAGYWTFLDRHRERLGHNHRTARPVRRLDRLTDLADVRRQERARGDAPP